MAWQKIFMFDPRDLLRLVTHYTDGEVPLDAEVGEVGFNPYLERMIGIEVESPEWETTEPLHIRYDCRKVLSWTKDGSQPEWGESPDSPKRQ
jgi:hypothetical protein